MFVYPQAYAAVVPQGARLKDEPRTFIIDIGGLTTDVLLLKHSVPDLHYCRSFETGVITMTNAVIGKVNAQHGIKLAEDQITAAIRGDKRLVLPQNIIDDREDLSPSGSASMAMAKELRMNVEDAVVAQDEVEHLHRAINALPERERQLIMMLYFEGQTVRQCADVCGVSHRTITVRKKDVLSKPRKFMRKSIQ